MAYSVLSNKEKPVYVADSTSDLNTLAQTNPPMGSSCLVLSNGEVYIINSNGQWIPLLGNSGGGSSSSYSNNNFKVSIYIGYSSYNAISFFFLTALRRSFIPTHRRWK